MKFKMIRIAGVALAIFGSSASFASSYNSNVVQEYQMPRLQIQKQNIVIAKKSSYYGERSAKTGRRKTVPVRGYRKKNGTYVGKHYRSPPRKNYSRKK